MLTITIDRAGFDAKVAELKQSEGIIISGDSGEISKSGVTVGYYFNEATSALVLKVTRKPFVVSTEYCEDKLRKWFEVA